MVSWCADDNAITRISVSAESSLAAVVPRPSLSLSVWSWNKASPWNRWVRSFPFFGRGDMRPDLVTLTEPGLTVLSGDFYLILFTRFWGRYAFALRPKPSALRGSSINAQNAREFICVDVALEHRLLLFPLCCFDFSKRLFSAFFIFSLISHLSNILPQRDATLSDGCLFGVGTGNWVRRLGDNSAFVAENCLCDHNADILQIRTFRKLCQSSNFIINRDIISRCIHPCSLSSPLFPWPVSSYRPLSCLVYHERMAHSGPQTASLPFFSCLSCFINVFFPDTAPCARIRGN